MRTFHGVCAVNELLVDRYFWHDEPVPAGDHEENRLYYKLRVPISDICRKPDCVVYRYWDDRPQPVTASSPDVPTIVYSVPGKRAVAAAVSYSSKDENVALAVDAKALGFTGAWRASDGETGEAVPADGGKITLALKKHDIRVLVLVPEAAK